MRLDRLLNEVDVFDRPLDASRIDVTAITERLDEVGPGALFCCVPGRHRDGHDLAEQAIAKGAVAVLVERELPISALQLRVSDVRASLGPLAAGFYDHPSRHLRMAGITGTNGKTTTTHLLASILRQHRWTTETIGTLSGAFTTPPPVELQRTLAELRAKKATAVVMEVSSAGLSQHRVDAIRFDVAVFTNLTQDHLDEHGTMSKYFEAKAMLFDPGRAEQAVINVDDPYGRRLVDRVAVPVLPVRLADAVGLEATTTGSSFEWGGARVDLPLVGEFNVHNALCAATAAQAMGVNVEDIARGLSSVAPVPGRVEQVDRGQPFTVLVDFAHTPDGLENVLRVARATADRSGGRVIVVFGAGGDRDPDKRSKMGAVVDAMADLSVVTNDNPRSEDPMVIAQQVVAGMARTDRVLVELDRERAIGRAVEEARAGDVVVLAGKGHEVTQEIAGQKLPFDDRAVAAAAIERTIGGGRS